MSLRCVLFSLVLVSCAFAADQTTSPPKPDSKPDSASQTPTIAPPPQSNPPVQVDSQGSHRGIRPRGSVADYPARQAGKGATIAAARIAPEKVAKLFATDLNRGGYLVVEVAVYPEAGGEVDVRSRDFLLRIGSDPATERTVSAQAIASALQRKNTPKPRKPGDVSIYPTATVGYETGTYNGQRHSGVYTAAGVGVGIGDPGPMVPPPGATGVDRDTMQQELEDKGLPEGKTSQAVAGYLFFPKPASGMRTGDPYHLTYYAAEGEVTLTIPAPTKK